MRTNHINRAGLLAFALATALPCAQAQLQPPGDATLQWGVSAGYNRYTEDAMTLAGPQLGLQAEWQNPLGLANWTLQAQVQAGAPDYSSPVSGSIDHRNTLQTTWAARYEWPGAAPWGLSGRVQTGLALQTYYNDLRGTTSAGHVGYERERYGLWASAGYSAPVEDVEAMGAQAWRVEVAALLQGVAKSHLSQVSSWYGDASNRQNRGLSVRTELSYRHATGEIRPYLQVTRLDNSDLQPVGNLWVVEPANTTWELGLQWYWR